MTIYLRAYNDVANAFINNCANDVEVRMRYNNYGVCRMLKIPETELPGVATFVERAAAISMPVLLCLRTGILSSLNSYSWQRYANELRAIAPYGQRFVVDVEQSSKEPDDQKILKTVSAPFMEVLRDYKMIPCMQRGMLDQGPARLMIEAAGGKGEIWDEVAYDASEKLRNDHDLSDVAEKRLLAMARNRTMFAREYPDVIVRHGSYEHIMQDCGVPAGVDFGIHDPWVFLSDRRAELEIGTKKWRNKSAQHSTNDVAHCWVVPPTFKNTISIPGGHQLAQQATGGYRAGDVFNKAITSFSVAISCTLPDVGEGPLFGESQENRDSWQVDVENDRFVLKVRRGGLTHRIIGTGAVPRGKSTRIVVVCANGVWTFSPTPSLVGIPLGVPERSGHLYVGYGIAIGAPTPRQVYAYHGLKIHGIEVAARAWSTAEIIAIETTPYPR